MKIIALCGFKNSGKSTVARYLTQYYGYVEISFASALKDITSIIYGFDRNILEGSTPYQRYVRETIRDPIWNKTGRQALQYLGTEVFRAQDPDIWVKIAMREIKKHELVVVSDLRFVNEYVALREVGAEIWQINRNTYSNEQINDMHISEKTFLEFPEPHAILQNTKSVEDLQSQVDMLLN